MRIRKATAQDVPAITHILRELGWFEHLRTASAASEQRVGQHLALCLRDDSHTVYVAEHDGGDVIAYAAVHWISYLMLTGPDGYVSELFVAEAARGQGIGAALLDEIAAEGRRRGCCRLSLLNVRARESYQRGFYPKHGWTERDVANFVLDLR